MARPRHCLMALVFVAVVATTCSAGVVKRSPGFIKSCASCLKPKVQSPPNTSRFYPPPRRPAVRRPAQQPGEPSAAMSHVNPVRPATPKQSPLYERRGLPKPNPVSHESSGTFVH